MKIIILGALLGYGLCFSQVKKDFQTLNLNLPKNTSEPYDIKFEKDHIKLEGKKCFYYELFHNVEKDGRKMRNYYEIKDLKNDIIFTGNISDHNSQKKWTDEITFVLLENKVYQNSNIVGRDNIILNLASNQVLGNDCSINIDNLKLFYKKSNEKK